VNIQMQHLIVQGLGDSVFGSSALGAPICLHYMPRVAQLAPILHLKLRFGQNLLTVALYVSTNLSDILSLSPFGEAWRGHWRKQRIFLRGC
jgi:hypothetical protein